MTTKEQVLEIFQKVAPASDLSEKTDIIEGGYINSFELMDLIASLNETFGIEVDLDDMTPENFNSADAVAALVEKLKNR